MLKHLFAALLCLTPALGFAQDKSRAILVLDASGSMWGQIDGKAKITIAQDVIGDLLQSLPAEQELGLTVYGHRRKGDCSDIETMILPGGDTRGAIMMAVSAITPKGKTPLSAAVIQAAEALKYTEERATVILVSDGRETCELDPCQVGRDLEKAGIDFTAHVIGFDISNPKDRAELQCLAEETGGSFRTAANADELGQALQVIAEPEPTPFKVTLRATETENGPDITDQLVWELYNAAGDLLTKSGPKTAQMLFDEMPGSYRVEAMRPADEENIAADFTVVDQNLTVTLVFPKLLPAASITAPDTAIAGSTIAINWQGPNLRNDHIAVAEIGSPGTKSIGYSYIKNGNPTMLKMPLHPGEYQLRYTMGLGSEILARRKIIITPVTASLSPPTPILAGSTFGLDWTGPNYKSDYISLAKPGSTAIRYETYAYTQHGSPMQLSAPTTPGTYLLRYIAAGPDQMAIASQQVEVIAVLATLESKDTIAAGSNLQVTWTGPDDKNDYIAINEIGDDLRGQMAYAYTKNSTDSALALKVPTTPGTYELRYIQNGKPKVILASKPITVLPVSATIEANATVPAGGTLQITWSGPNDKRDYIAVAEVGGSVNTEVVYEYLERSQGQTITLNMPNTIGDYELRYIQNGKPRSILAARPLTITAVQAAVDSDDTVSAGGRLVVTWAGPNGARDYIALAEVGSPVSKDLAYEYVERSDGQKLGLVMPTTTGQYELRYIQNGSPKVMLAMKPVTILAVSASLDADANTPSGGKLLVNWTGPNNKRDYISIDKIGGRVGKEVTYAYLSNSDGPAIFIDVPGVPGDYELRYIQNGTPKTVLARRALTVETVGATLTAKATVAPGANLVVEWSGPNYKNDRIAISRVGDKRIESYVYTRNGSPLIIKAPDGVGDFELLYVMGQDGHILTRLPLQVE